MSREEKENSPEFVEYMTMMVNHPNYRGLPIKQDRDGNPCWVAAKNSAIGQQRQAWIDNKARSMGIPVEPGSSAKVMRAIHPTGERPCQICGQTLSIFYYYPNVSFIKALSRRFGIETNECDHIDDIWDRLLLEGITESDIIGFMIDKFKLSNDYCRNSRDEIISACEQLCRNGNKKLLGPGAMSDAPDRFDGFHSYNRCCRASEDKGRHTENMKSYTKDRRAYEYWSDGNIHAANQFMGSQFFKGTSADHVGPISLGFVHDPRYLRPMPAGENSTKRNRLRREDIEAIIQIERKTSIYPMSWQSSEIWEMIKRIYQNASEQTLDYYRDLLLQNMSNYMFVLYTIIHKAGLQGIKLVDELFIQPKYSSFCKSYRFNELGEIVGEIPRHFTERNQNEFNRFRRIALEAVDDFIAKENRQHAHMLIQSELQKLDELCAMVVADAKASVIKCGLQQLMVEIQKRLLK